MEFVCETCLKDFQQKNDYERHIARKIPCKPSKLAIAAKEANISVGASTFRDNSLKMNNELDKDIRQENGIFFTPRKARELLWNTLDSLEVKPTSILEPSFGSGEFIDDALERYGPEVSLTGVELNEKLFKSVVNSGRRGTYHNIDFLEFGTTPTTTTNPCKDLIKKIDDLISLLNNENVLVVSEETKKDTTYDLIIGNPPYFVCELKNPNCMVHRSNIYVAFLYKCLTEHLKENGYLAFVLPTSLFNCSYYEPMRKYIAANCTIHFVQELDVKYYQTGQDTMLIVLQKKVDPEKKYLFERNGSKYISPDYKTIRILMANTTTIKDLGLRVKTGDVVWNQEKESLTDDSVGDSVLLIYNTNIINRTLVIGNISDKKNEKKQYIKGFKRPVVKGPAILVNRGHGNASYKFNYVLIEDNREFYAENHVNMILGNISALKKVAKSFEDSRSDEYIKMFVGNGAMSKTEIESVLPIFLD